MAYFRKGLPVLIIVFFILCIFVFHMFILFNSPIVGCLAVLNLLLPFIFILIHNRKRYAEIYKNLIFILYLIFLFFTFSHLSHPLIYPPDTRTGMGGLLQYITLIMYDILILLYDRSVWYTLIYDKSLEKDSRYKERSVLYWLIRIVVLIFFSNILLFI